MNHKNLAETFCKNGGSCAIIDGTTAVQDTLPRMVQWLGEVAPWIGTAMAALPFGPIPSHALDDRDDPWWRSEECQSRFNEVWEALCEHSPEGFLFGVHPDDPARLGWWPCEGGEF